jgi:chromosome partitioning protein
VAVAYTAAEWETIVADLELGQATSRKWAMRREEADLKPSIYVKSFGSVSALEIEIKKGDKDIFIIDSPAFATKSSIDIALISNLVVLPTGYSEDDMNSTAEMANSLVLEGIDSDKICIVFSGVDEQKTQSAREKDYAEAITYFSALPYKIIDGYIPRTPALRKALDSGRSITECIYPGPRAKADHVVQGIITRLEQLTGE